MPPRSSRQGSRRNRASSRSPHEARADRTQDEGAVSGEGSRRTHLSREVLARHDSSESQSDHSFAQELVREEQRRDFHQASYESLQPDQPRDKLLPEENSAEVERRRLSPSFQESLGLYPRPEQSSTAPFQRFATLGGTNDPNSLLAKQALGNMGIQPGDMQTAQMRGALAEEVTKEAQGMKRTSSLTTGPLTGHRGKRRRNRRSSVDDQTSEHESESSEE